MFRVARLFRKQQSAFKQCIRTITTEAELEEKFYFKEPLDPLAKSLLEKYEPDIAYCSYLETKRKPLSFVHRATLHNTLKYAKAEIQLEKARRKPFSVALQHLPGSLQETNTDEADLNLKAKHTEQKNRDDTSNKTLDLNESRGDERRKVILTESKLNILKEMSYRQSEMEDNINSNADSWMQDYETYKEDDEDEMIANSQYGTPDPNMPISKVPCHGCGALLHCADPSIPGYLPSELIKGHKDSILKTLICQRCHFLKNYNTALQVKVSPDEYVKIISEIKDKKALVILMVDIVDFPCSIWPNIIDIIGPKRPVFVVGNKIDLLPQDSRNYLEHIKKCMEDSLIESGFSETNIMHTCLISAETNYGVEELITNLYDVWSNKGDVYLIGCTNVGKSTLFNAMLRSDYCKVKARNLIKRATASIWPGTTLRMLKFPILRPTDARIHERRQRLHNERIQNQELQAMKRKLVMTGQTPQTTLMGHIGQTVIETKPEAIESELSLHERAPLEKYFNENNYAFRNSKWCFDTPGVVQKEQTINMLTSEELLYAIPKKVLWPRVFLMKRGYSLFVAGLGRLDYVGASERVQLAVYASEKLSILIVDTEKANEVYRDCLGSELLSVPRGDEERLKKWPELVRCDNLISVSNYESCDTSVCDIVLSSAGWVSVNMPVTETANFYAWTPECRGIFVRKPSLLPYGAKEYRGKRIKYTPAYLSKLPKQTRH